MQRYLMTAVTLGAIALAACSDTTGLGNASDEDREEILQLLQESGFFADDFGVAGVAEGASPAAALAAAGAVAEEIAPPRAWGRRHGPPVQRLITIDVDSEAGTALVTKELVFEGEFLLDITQDDQFNPTSKPLNQTLVQHAQFRRNDAATAEETGRRWRLVAVSPAEVVLTDPLKQTVDIARLEVWVDGELYLEVEDPSQLFEVDGRVPRLHPEQEVTVKVWVDNSSTAAFTPPTFVYLHLFHASLEMRMWVRLPMEQVVTDTDVHWTRSWVVRHAGRERIAVDAIDAGTFATQDGDDYNANIWGVPYVIE
ncbi:MAG: hypothetical protein AMS20_12165 [Gemmatimonas sp. SG8_28]|nr:MAG: hypothetical protein AMS20_12165 [Gemmatimonas sp. SG8_28]